MKPILPILGAVFFLFLAGAAYTFFFVVRPARLALIQAKPTITARAAEFLTCLTKGEVPSCSPALTTANYQRITPPELLSAITSRMHDRLGAFQGGQIDDSSFHLVQNQGGAEAGMEANFRLKAQFELAPEIPVDFTLVQKGNGPFLVDRFGIDSPKMLEP